MADVSASADTDCGGRLVPPGVVDAEADRRFAELARSFGLDPAGRWVGGYVEYEWSHARHFLVAALSDLAGRRILEFGCNLGATAVVLASLGAEVVGVDVSERNIRLAELNARRHGVGGRAEFRHIADTRRMDWPDGEFEAIVCNSVLEYVSKAERAAVMRELDRLLRPGGLLLVLGTSNRLSPREVHSGRWGVNYLPDALTPKGGRAVQKGVWPGEILRAFRGYANVYRQDAGREYFAAKRAVGLSAPRRCLLRAADLAARCLGLTAGLLTPSVNVALRKPPARGDDGRRTPEPPAGPGDR